MSGLIVDISLLPLQERHFRRHLSRPQIYAKISNMSRETCFPWQPCEADAWEASDQLSILGTSTMTALKVMAKMKTCGSGYPTH